MADLTRYTEDDNEPTTRDPEPRMSDDAQALVQKARYCASHGDLSGAELCLLLAGVLP